MHFSQLQIPPNSPLPLHTVCAPAGRVRPHGYQLIPLFNIVRCLFKSTSPASGDACSSCPSNPACPPLCVPGLAASFTQVFRVRSSSRSPPLFCTWPRGALSPLFHVRLPQRTARLFCARPRRALSSSVCAWPIYVIPVSFPSREGCAPPTPFPPRP